MKRLKSKLPDLDNSWKKWKRTRKDGLLLWAEGTLTLKATWDSSTRNIACLMKRATSWSLRTNN